MVNMTEQTTKYGTWSLTSRGTHNQRERSPRRKISALAVAAICVVAVAAAAAFHSKNILSAKDPSPLSVLSEPLGYTYAPQESSLSLLLIRHAKSSWEDPDIADEQRPLDSEGAKDAQRLGAFLSKHKVRFPDMILASPSVRTRQTLQLVQSNNWAADVPVQYDKRLYTLAMTSYIDFCHELDPQYQRVLLVGHNPAMKNTGRQLLENQTLKFPPGTFLEIVLENATDWSSIDNGKCRAHLLVTPNMT